MHLKVGRSVWAACALAVKLLVGCLMALANPAFAQVPISQLRITATGASSPRALADRFAERVDVKDFGAIENGTTDDSGALAAAVTEANALMAGGRSACVYIPTGTLYVNGATAIPSFTSGYPGCVKGEGSQQSIISLGSGFSGDLFSWSEAWVASKRRRGTTDLRGFQAAAAMGSAA